MICEICCENYNKTRHFKVCCPYCEFEACRSCCETYLLNETIPKCMKRECDKEWSRNFLRKNFTNKFLTSEYKKHMENLLFDKEKSLFPATQPLVEQKIMKEKLKKELKEINELINALIIKKKELEYKINIGDFDTKEINKSTSRFVRQCPADNCRGYLSSQWKCGICEKWTCPDCHEVKGSSRDCEHTCNPNNVETAKMLANDSKPCPKCQSLIFKIDGCDQMWCTQCHTAFSWKTGKLESNIHNPHYYEWQRKNSSGAAPRNPGDFECGRDLTHNTVNQIEILSRQHDDLHKSKSKTVVSWITGRKEMQIKYEYNNNIICLSNMITNMIHNNFIELPTFNVDFVIKNQDLRIKYLENVITEEEFKVKIQKNDKKHKKNIEVGQILQLANISFTDIIYRIIDNLKTSSNGNHEINNYLKEIEELINYCNNILKDIAFTYKTIQYKFDNEFKFIKLSLPSKKINIINT